MLPWVYFVLLICWVYCLLTSTLVYLTKADLTPKKVLHSICCMWYLDSKVQAKDSKTHDIFCPKKMCVQVVGTHINAIYPVNHPVLDKGTCSMTLRNGHWWTMQNTSYICVFYLALGGFLWKYCCLTSREFQSAYSSLWCMQCWGQIWLIWWKQLLTKSCHWCAIPHPSHMHYSPPLPTPLSFAVGTVPYY